MFSSSKFKHGETTAKSGDNFYKLYHGKIYKTDSSGKIYYDNDKNVKNTTPIDFSITKGVVSIIFVSIIMMSGLEKLNWTDSTELLPALIIIVMIPLTFSIANGIALGFLAYVVLKISNGEIKNISSGAWFLTAVFVSKFIFL